MTWGFHTGRPGQSRHGHCTLVAAGSLRSLHHPGPPLPGLASPMPGPRRSSAMSWGLPWPCTSECSCTAFCVMCNSPCSVKPKAGLVSGGHLAAADAGRWLAAAWSTAQSLQTAVVLSNVRADHPAYPPS